MSGLADYSIQIVASVLASASLGSLITIIAGRGKYKAETNNIIGKTYGDLLDDLRATVKFQGEQIKMMQEREFQLLKIISAGQAVEKELREELIQFGAQLELCMQTKK